MCCEEGGQENELQLCARKESGQLEKVLFFKNFHLILFSLSASAAWSPLDIFTFKLPLCCSSSVSSEEPSLERQKPETGENKEEETLKESAATAEELVALSPSPPPAVQEVPPHLRKQHVRKYHDGCFQIIDFFFFFPLTLTSCPSLQIPEEFDIDSENSEDCFLCPEYAKDIFDYLKDREVRTLRNKSNHLNKKLDVTCLMLDHFQDDKLTQNFESSVGKVHPL